jgi:hypothetical protein
VAFRSVLDVDAISKGDSRVEAINMAVAFGCHSEHITPTALVDVCTVYWLVPFCVCSDV